MTTLLKGGTIVSDTEIVKKDLLIQGDKILEISGDIPVKNEDIELFDVSNKLIMPGMIDAHTHFTDMSVADNVETGSLAGAFGGVTTFIDYMWQLPDLSIKETYDMYLEHISGTSMIDFSFHFGLPMVSEKSKKELAELKNIGINSLKIFTTFRDGPLFPPDNYSELFQISKDLELLLTIHAEDDEIIYNLENKYTEKGLTGIAYFADTRPPESEAEAIRKMGEIADRFQLPIFIVHVSSKQGMDTIRSLRSKAVTIFCETRPHYLVLSSDGFSETELAKYLVVPPIRSKKDQIELLKSLQAGEIQTIASDHFAQNIDMKLGNKKFAQPIMGLPGIESMLPLIHHFGVNREIIDYKKLVQLLSTNPAKIFGLYPEKGSLKAGTDADLVVFDPNQEVKLTHDLFHSKVGFTAFEGINVTGYPVMTFLRGKLIVNNGELVGDFREGKFIKGKRSNLFN